MSNAVTPHTFTKLVVDDLDAMARYYGSVFGLTELTRVQAEVGGSPIDEIILSLPTHPLAARIHQDLPDRLRHHGIPVTGLH